MSNPMICNDCAGTSFVEDRSAGDIICRKCGLVAESHVIDERSEWRTFADKDKDGGGDPNRVGGASNPLLGNNTLSTVIQQTRGDGGVSFTLNKLHNRSSNPDRALLQAFRKVGSLCETLNLPGVVKDSACEIYKNVTTAKLLKGRQMQAIIAACVYLAARQDGNTLTFREITAVIPDVCQKEIGRCFTQVMQMMKEQAEETKGTDQAAKDFARSSAPISAHPADHVVRFCGLLNLDFQTLKAAKTMAYNCKPVENSVNAAQKLYPWDGRNPSTIAAAILFIICGLSKIEGDHAVTMQQIVIVTQMAEATIRSAYREIFPYLATLLPDNYAAQTEVMSKLPVPERAMLRAAGLQQQQGFALAGAAPATNS